MCCRELKCIGGGCYNNKEKKNDNGDGKHVMMHRRGGGAQFFSISKDVIAFESFLSLLELAVDPETG